MPAHLAHFNAFQFFCIKPGKQMNSDDLKTDGHVVHGFYIKK